MTAQETRAAALYRQKAHGCLSEATNTYGDPRRRDVLLAAADKWIRLAELANGEAA